MSDVPRPVLALLARGQTESVNLMEWLATDMAALARAVASKIGARAVKTALRHVADQMKDQGVTIRLTLAGKAIAGVVSGPKDPAFKELAQHRSDVVRQWACYAVNDRDVACSLKTRLRRTLPFAGDPNMSVREAAWMAFRPHIAVRLEEALELLEPVSRSDNLNLRRFAIEVTRPRSVWGAHIEQLKRHPGMAAPLLENVRQDPSRYVQLAAGNWLNDASKTRPDWVVEKCRQWAAISSPHTDAIVRRGLRTLTRENRVSSNHSPLAQASLLALNQAGVGGD